MCELFLPSTLNSSFTLNQKHECSYPALALSFEWLMYLDVERTPFNEKIFAIVDFDSSGEMDFRGEKLKKKKRRRKGSGRPM